MEAHLRALRFYQISRLYFCAAQPPRLSGTAAQEPSDFPQTPKNWKDRFENGPVKGDARRSNHRNSAADRGSVGKAVESLPACRAGEGWVLEGLDQSLHMTGFTAEDLLLKFAVPARPLYLVGIFEHGVTVYSQQIRAFNLIWALVQRSILDCKPNAAAPDRVKRKRATIAIVGGGFAGLTAAAALIKKGADADITIFEQRDTLLPLQHGSDTRWLHPRIYNWPADGSESAVADLPILNWTAARASDVAAQILLEWREIAKPAQDRLTVYCNVHHVQVHERGTHEQGLTIEWVGDKRLYDGGTTATYASVGATQVFDHVIVAVGYGLEKDSALSYWRNDTLGQPSLAEPHRTYLVSGQGDGAMIEVLRLRISQYRQDRILEELIVQRPGLHKAVKALQEKFPEPKTGMFDAFEALNDEPEFQAARNDLERRLRRDTEVILHLKKRMLAALFEDPTLKIAFQNRLLIYLLYKCGGFVPTCTEIPALMEMRGIPDTNVIQRHGTEVDKNLESLLSDLLMREVTDHFRGRGPTLGKSSDLSPKPYSGQVAISAFPVRRLQPNCWETKCAKNGAKSICPDQLPWRPCRSAQQLPDCCSETTSRRNGVPSRGWLELGWRSLRVVQPK